MNIITGHIIDIDNRNIFPGEIHIDNGKIADIKPSNNVADQYILPGFIDAHIHIESSMLAPSEFAKIAVKHGTVATVSDPHEIANVCGIKGIDYMIDNSRSVPFKFFFGAPSCVPATTFETAGATINSHEIEGLLQGDDLWYLSEMMNYPGVLNEDSEVIAKLNAARKAKKPIDGHAPGLKGDAAKKYAGYGISTDHECFTLEEALDKINAGMSIIIREGSAAKNFEALHPLLKSHPEKVMFCSDDKHPDELVISHINHLVKRSIDLGYDLYDVLKAVCINPVKHYNIPVGMLRQNDPADFIIVNNPDEFEIIATYINGIRVAQDGESLITSAKPSVINNFNCRQRSIEDFKIKAKKSGEKINVIQAINGQIITDRYTADKKTDADNYIISDTNNDVLKICVMNRYNDADVSIAFVKGFGLKQGAIASTVAHDCHNIIAVGTNDNDICEAVNAIIKHKGGIAASDSGNTQVMPLPIAGLMSDENGCVVAEQYSQIDKRAKQMGTQLLAPFMTLSFMALLVIPSLKISDKGLFDGSGFKFTDVEV